MATSSAPPPPAPANPGPQPFSWWRNPALHDRAFRLLCQAAALFVVLLLGLLIVFLVVGAWPAITRFGFGFLFSSDWDPNPAAPGKEPSYGALHFIWGTLYTSGLAMLLAAIPSVVYGFWGFYFLRPVLLVLLRWLDEPLQQLAQNTGMPWLYASNPDGRSLLLAGVVLAVMILPYVTAITYDVCQAVPRSQREGALALGSTRWQMIWRVVLPYAQPGILGGCFLALGRALGETMAVVMLVGSDDQALSLSPLGQGASIASQIADKFMGSSYLQKAVLVELGLVLLLVTVVINSVARLLIWRVQAGGGRSGNFVGWLRWGRHPATETVPASVPPQPAPPLPANPLAAWTNRIMTGVLGLCTVVTLGPLFLILGYITWMGVSHLDLTFFTHLERDDPPGLAHALYGSAMLVTLATLWAVPIGVLASVYLVEYRTSRLASVVRFVGELLSGVPSIVLGLFAYAFVVLPLTGFSGWAAIFALGVMMIPIVMRSSEESLKLVPQSLRNASFALGAAHWQTVVRVTVPAALSAIVTGVFLAMARIAGETAPLLLTADHTEDWVWTPAGHTPYLTYYIYNWSLEGGAQKEPVAWAAAFVLLALVMVLNIGIRLATGRRLGSASRAD
jgi:phosphate transport system permease protein